MENYGHKKRTYISISSNNIHISIYKQHTSGLIHLIFTSTFMFNPTNLTDIFSNFFNS